MANNSEASVEEILESIKKVIARDSRDSAIDARNRKVDAASKADRQPKETPEPTEAEEILDLAEMELSEIVEMDADIEAQDASPEESLITEEVRGAMQDNLAALAMLAEPGAKPQIVRSGETSLEGMTRELLRPMLAEWLDKNLPTMVETMVQAEIARIAGKRG
jgi:cell pole-organizing protein PopZ